MAAVEAALTPARTLPKFVQVGPYRLEVILTDKIPTEWGVTADDAGMVVLDVGRIWIRKSLCHDRQVEVLWHEIGHVLSSLAPLEFDDPTVEEAIVARLAPLYVDFIRRNPKVVAYTQETASR